MDKVWIYEWPESSLNSDWKRLDEFQTIQHVDLVPKLFEVTEHRARLYLHRTTGEKIATLPEEVTRAGLVGPRLSALIAYQKGACHMTYRVIQTFLADVLQLDLSTGQRRIFMMRQLIPYPRNSPIPICEPVNGDHSCLRQ